jgi:hypothetical protein
MEYGKANAVDIDTNYINGCLFQNSINVNPNGTTTLTAPGVTTHIALTKYNRQGELLWARMFGGVTTSEAPHGIECDATRNIYVTGYFGSTTLTGPQPADFNPAGGGTVNTQGHEDCFVAKYAPNGNYVWAFGLGNAGANTQERAWDIAVDAVGNAYVAGGFHGTVNFNPLGTAANRSLPDTLAGLFVAKYNSDGILQWVIPIDAQCTSVFTEGYAACDLDNSGNICVAGNFRGSNVDFNPLGTATLLTSSGLTDMFIAKYTASTGVLSWVKRIGGPAAEIVSPGALRCDNSGNPYFTGRLSGTGSVDFDPSPGTVNVTNSALFLASFDGSGNLRLAFGMNSGTGDGGHRVAFDNLNNVYIAGWMNGTANFGNGYLLSAFSSTADVFLAKYTNAGVCQWAFNFGGTGSSDNSICAGLVVDQENNPIVTGQLYGINADVDPTGGVLNLSSVGNNDCFVIKYTTGGELWSRLPVNVYQEALNTPIDFQLDQNYPNPFNPRTTISFVLPKASTVSLAIFNTQGTLIDVLLRTYLSAGKHAVHWDASGIPSGVYFYTLTTEEGATSKKSILLR